MTRWYLYTCPCILLIEDDGMVLSYQAEHRCARHQETDPAVIAAESAAISAAQAQGEE